MRVEGSTGLGWPKQRWSDAMNADLRRLDLERNDLNDRVRWKSFVELEVRQKTRHPIRTWRWTVSEQIGQNNIVCPTANARIIFSLLQSGIAPSIKFRKRLRCNLITIVSQLHFLKQVNRFPLYRLTGWLWAGAILLRIRYHQSFSVSIGDKR